VNWKEATQQQFLSYQIDTIVQGGHPMWQPHAYWPKPHRRVRAIMQQCRYVTKRTASEAILNLHQPGITSLGGTWLWLRVRNLEMLTFVG